MGLAVAIAAQAPTGAVDARLRTLFPAAASFSAKGGTPPHYTAFARSPKGGDPVIVGFAFLTTDLEPLESGYDDRLKLKDNCIMISSNTEW